MNVGNESDEVTNRRIKDTESGCGISLRVWRVRKIADRFQTNHGGNLVTAGFASASVNKTSHLFAEKIGRLFIHKGDEPERVLCRSSGESARQREHRSDAAAVVVCAGRTEDRVVVRADEHNLGASTGNFRLDVVTSLALQFVTV